MIRRCGGLSHKEWEFLMRYNVKRHAVVQPLDQSIKIIPLTKGLNAIVSSHRYEFLNQFNWSTTSSNGKVYAHRMVNVDGKRISVQMHRVILPGYEQVDHQDGDGLNNRDSNLRPCSGRQNQGNRKKNANNTSGYKGVRRHVNGWRVVIAGKTVAYCKSADDGARIYDEHAISYFGEFAHLNFP